MEGLGLVITLRGGHFSQHEAACGAERIFFECFWCAQTTHVVCAHAGAQSFFASHASATCHSAARPGQAALPPTVKASLATNLLLPARFGLPPTARSLSSGFVWTKTAGLIWAAVRKRKVQVASVIRDDGGPGAATLCAHAGPRRRARRSPRGGAPAATPMVCTF